MVFSTPIFLFYFLTLTLLVYYLVPRRLRNPVLLCASLLFYFWGERTYTVIMLLSTAIDYTHGMLVERCKARGNDRGAGWRWPRPWCSIWGCCSSSSTGTFWPILSRPYSLLRRRKTRWSGSRRSSAARSVHLFP